MVYDLDEEPSKPERWDQASLAECESWLLGTSPEPKREADSDEVPFVVMLIFMYPLVFLWYAFFLNLGLFGLTGKLAWDGLIPPLAFAVSSFVRCTVREWESRQIKRGAPRPVGRQRPIVLLPTMFTAGSFGALGGWLVMGTTAGQSLQPPALTLIIGFAVWEALQSLRKMPG